MTDDDSGWIVIIPPSRPADATAALAAWRRAHPAVASSLGPDDILIDTMRTQNGDRVRIRARLPR
ncbi:MAG: hypothetical protein K8W52_23480 [Deltaproteobacteria bacterium]|nr:hypothetical protein [Deltaproteobacteria bacterium]